MKIPTVRGIIDRRILVNFRVDPGVLRRVVPEPFAPLEYQGSGIAGICLIRLRAIRPRFVPGFLGIRSENAAHRIAVEWKDGDALRTGVYIPRRDTSSSLNAWAGGRLFPGEHHHARFTVSEEKRSLRVAFRSDDGGAHGEIEARPAPELPPHSIFGSLEEASSFFERGSLGYSETSIPGVYHGLELKTSDWKIEPLEVTRAVSSFFEDRSRFPEGSVEFDCALLMRNLRHEWHGRDTLVGSCCAGGVTRLPRP